MLCGRGRDKSATEKTGNHNHHYEHPLQSGCPKKDKAHIFGDDEAGKQIPQPEKERADDLRF